MVGLAAPAIGATWQPNLLHVVETNQPSIEVFPEERCALFRQSDQISIRVKGGASIRITSWRGNIVYEGRPSKLRLPCGHYFVEDGRDRTQFAVLPDDYQGVDFLGTEGPPVGFGTLYLRLARINPAYFRTMGGGTYWSEVQPARNQWKWFNADVQMVNVGNRKLIYQAFVRPAWVTDGEFIPCYAEFVQRVAKRYGKKLYAIEIWNEVANNGVPGNDLASVIDNYAKLVRASYEAVRKVSPTVKLLGPAWYGPGFNDETRRLAELGTFHLLDGFSFHDGMGSVMAPDTLGGCSLDSYGHRSTGIVKQLQIYRAAVGNKPMFVDELALFGKSALGLPDDLTTDPLLRSDLTWQRGMYRTVKSAVLYRTFNAVLIPFVFALNGNGQRPAFQRDGWELGGRGPHPKTSAFLMTCYWLNNATYLGESAIGSNGLLYAWRRPDGSSLVFAWCREGYSTSFQPNPALPRIDIFGQPVSDTTFDENPILFHVPASVPSNSVLAAVAATLQPPQPDYPNLIVPVMVYPANAAVGDTIQVMESLQNLGTRAGPFAVGFYLWSRATGDILIDAHTVNGLAPGATITETNSITIPLSIGSGAYQFHIVADYLNSFQQIDEPGHDRYGGGLIVISGGLTNRPSGRPIVPKPTKP